MHDLGAGWSDTQIWDYAAANGLTIVSKDADFSDRVLLGTAGPSVIHIRVGNFRMEELHQYLTGILAGCVPRQRRHPLGAGVSGQDREHRLSGDGGGLIPDRGRGRRRATPEDVAKVKESYTGRYLKELLGRRAGGAQKESANGCGKRQAAE